MENATNARQILLTLIAFVAWFALIAQFYININSKLNPLPEVIIRYFSYFTLLSNLLVALACTYLAGRPDGSGFFSRTTVLTAITVYIVIVGIVYNTVLRSIWDPKGLQKVVDELLHVGTPILFLLFWLFFVPKGSLRWKDSFPWMGFPFVYGVCVLLRGSQSGFYPYPFINLDQLGWNQTIIHIIGFTLAFLGTGLLFVGIGKRMSRRRSN